MTKMIEGDLEMIKQVHDEQKKIIDEQLSLNYIDNLECTKDEINFILSKFDKQQENIQNVNRLTEELSQEHDENEWNNFNCTDNIIE